MEALLAGQSIREIARRRRVRVGCVYAQRSKAISKLRRLVAGEALEAEQEDQQVAYSARVGPGNGDCGNRRFTQMNADSAPLAPEPPRPQQKGSRWGRR